MNTLLLSLALITQCSTSATGVTTCQTGGLLSGLFGNRSTTVFGAAACVPATSFIAPATSFIAPSYIAPTTSYIAPATSYIAPTTSYSRRASYVALESPEVKMGYHKVKHQGVLLTVYGFRNEKGMIEWEPDHPHNNTQLVRKTVLAERLDGR
jgi:hypothetical protein